MAAPKGNKNAVGNRGGGHPTHTETIWHRGKWENDEKVRELEEKIASGVYAIRDVWLLKALKGNDAILKQAADKVLADLHDVTSDGKSINQPPTPEQVIRFSKRHEKVDG